MARLTKNTEQPHCQSCHARFRSVFCDLNGQELDELDEHKGCIHVKKGQVIFQEGSRAQGLYCINDGKIKLSKTGDEGKDHIVQLVKEGDIIGYNAVLSGEPYSLTATAIEDSKICFVPKSFFFQVVESNGNLSLQIMKLLSSSLKSTQKNLTDIAQKPVRERLAEALLFLKETYGYESDEETLNVILTREEIANIVGTATETVIRLLSEFNHDQMIALNGKRIKILNHKALLKTANIFY